MALHEETEEKLPNWALEVMIVLRCLSAVFLVTVIHVCVSIAFCSFLSLCELLCDRN